MHTLNVRQLRALALVAPGTLALNDGSTLSRLVFHTTTDDAERSGVYRIDVDQDGNVTQHRTEGRWPIQQSYADLIAAEAEAAAEQLAALSEAIEDAERLAEDPYLDAALAEAEWADDAGMSDL